MIPEVPPGRYFIQSGAVDAAGNWSGFKTIGNFQIISNPEYVTVTDFSSHCSSVDSLGALAVYHGPSTIGFYRYRILRIELENCPGIPVTGWMTSETPGLRVTGNHPLDEGLYCFEVIGIFSDGKESTPVISPGCRLDRTPPEILRMDIDEYISERTFEMSWEIFDSNELEEISLELWKYKRDSYGNFIPLETQGRESFEKKRIEIIHLVPEKSAERRLLSFSGGEPLIPGDCVEVHYSVLDKAGNFSRTGCCPLVFDNTPPSFYGVSGPVNI